MILFFSSIAKYSHSEKLYHTITIRAEKGDMKHMWQVTHFAAFERKHYFASLSSLLNSQDHTLVFIKITNRFGSLTCANPMATRTLKNKDSPSHFHGSTKGFRPGGESAFHFILVKYSLLEISLFFSLSFTNSTLLLGSFNNSS